MVAHRTRPQPHHNGGRSFTPTEWVDEHPFQSIAVVFGIGLGVGLILGHTIAEAAGRRMFHEDGLTGKLACQFRDILRKTLPESLVRPLS